MFILIYWFKTSATFAALSWVFWRAYLVLTKPVDELVNVLGLEVPSIPEVSLAAVRSDSVVLHWKPSDQRNSLVKYQVQCNGSIIGDVAPQESSVLAEKLSPDHFYTARVISVNASGFQAVSSPIRFKTSPAVSEDSQMSASEAKGAEASISAARIPSVRPLRSFLDSATTITAPPMVREMSGSQPSSRRMAIGRRNSPATPGSEQGSSSADQFFEREGSVRQLTERLEELRRDNEDGERQILEEDEQFELAKAALSKEKEYLRQSLKDREEVTKELKKQVGSLERTNAAAQSKRSLHEKVLHNKHGERKRINADMARWEKEINDMKLEIERLQAELVRHRAAAERRIAELREKQEYETQSTKHVEEEVKQKGIHVKELDEEIRQESGNGSEDDINQHGRTEVEEERNWEEKRRTLQSRYTSAWGKMQQAQRTFFEARNRLETLNTHRSSQANLFTPVVGHPDNGVRLGLQQRRAPSGQQESLSSTGTPFNLPDQRLHLGAHADTGHSIAFPSTSSPRPLFATLNGKLNDSPTEQTNYSPRELERMTAGAPLSPSAGALIPSNLLRDDGDGEDYTGADKDEDGPEAYRALAVSTHNLSAIGPLPGLGAPQTLERALHGRHSPASLGSRSPSLFSSPKESSANLSYYHQHQGSDSLMDSDRRSVRSASGSFRGMGPPGGAAPASSRFATMFGINRARGKTLSDEGLAFGALKASQSQSMPRHSEDDQDPSAARRRRISYSGNLLSNVLRSSNGNTAGPVSDKGSPEEVTSMGPPRRRPFDMFTGRRSLWSSSVIDGERSASPRPTSTYSLENGFPRPSTELGNGLFGWGDSDTFLNRPASFGPEWPYASSASWSQHPSRRPSVHYAGSLSLEKPLLEADGTELDAQDASLQPPIGTKPRAASRSPSPQPKLNPAAKDFKFLFSYKKGEKGEKSAGKGKKDKDKLADDTTESSVEGLSPPNSRKSRDTDYLSGLSSEVGAPLERSESAGTPTDLSTSTSSAKGFMQKISRKGSSGKFSLPGFKDRGLFSKKGAEIGTPDETDEDSLAKLSRSFDSLLSSPQVAGGGKSGGGLSWGSFRKKGKKGDQTPSVSEASIASEGALEEEEGEGLLT